MKAIVLGATGFIGSHIVRALNGEEIDVRILRRTTSPMLALEGLQFEEALGDLNDPKSLKKSFQGCHILFHAAGYYPVYSWQRREQTEQALRQMKNVLEAAESSGIQKIIYTSSMSTIGKPGKKLADETSPYDPGRFKGLYYDIKFRMEREALAAAKRGLPVTIVNPTGVFGDYDVKPTSGIFIVKVARREVPVIIDAKINAVDVRDVAVAQIAAMKLGKIGRRYLLGGHNTTVLKLAQSIARLAGVPAPKMTIPIRLAQPAAWLSEFVGYYLFRSPRPAIPRVGLDFLKNGIHYDTTRAETELGLKKRPLEETLKRAIEWFRKNSYC